MTIMAAPELWLFRHKDARWVQLTLHARRLDRTEGVKGRATRHVYTTYKSAAAVQSAAKEQRHEIHSERYLRVARLGKFVDLPEADWLDTATLARKRKPVLAGKPVGPIETRVAALDAIDGVVVTLKRGKPATAKALDAAERALGKPLPPSLRAFLGKHDGLTVEWKLAAHGWGVAFEVFSLRALLEERKLRGATVELKGGLLLPICPTYGREVVGALLRDRGEAKIVELLDPPDSKHYDLAPSFATLVEKAAANYFVITGRRDVAERALPAMRKVLR